MNPNTSQEDLNGSLEDRNTYLQNPNTSQKHLNTYFISKTNPPAAKSAIFRPPSLPPPHTMKNHPQHLPGLPEPFLMVAVPGGRFDMGGESWDNKRSMPIHPVELDDFWMGEHPVTQALWMAVMGEADNPSHFKGLTRPVETVSWELIDQEFLRQLNKITLDSRPPGTVYRLPTEAEWEYAARGGKHGKEKPYLFSGSEISDEVGWYNENSHGETKPVGLKLPNELGIFDMSGNVWEWCVDWYGGDYYQKCLDEGMVKNLKGPEKGSYRVLRGGSWLGYARLCRSTYRDSITPAARDGGIGFRLVLSALPV
jgi:formylglycine-generating enzyme required for sulfatase activity